MFFINATLGYVILRRNRLSHTKEENDQLSNLGAVIRPNLDVPSIRWHCNCSAVVFTLHSATD
jgi:hypothetical protein